MPRTKRGIYHNLRESEYTISNGEVVYFFSSELYLNKFLDGYKQNRLIFLNKLAKIVVDDSLNMETFADIEFYKKIEKRGYYAWLKGVEISCNEIYRLYALRKMIEKNTLDWSRIQKPKLEERLKIMV